MIITAFHHILFIKYITRGLMRLGYQPERQPFCLASSESIERCVRITLGMMDSDLFNGLLIQFGSGSWQIVNAAEFALYADETDTTYQIQQKRISGKTAQVRVGIQMLPFSRLQSVPDWKPFLLLTAG